MTEPVPFIFYPNTNEGAFEVDRFLAGDLIPLCVTSGNGATRTASPSRRLTTDEDTFGEWLLHGDEVLIKMTVWSSLRAAPFGA
jgi:hypothetical protein